MNSKKVLAIFSMICFTGVAASFAQQADWPSDADSSAAVESATQIEVAPVPQPSAALFMLPEKTSLIPVGTVNGQIIGNDSTMLQVKDDNNADLGSIHRELGGFRHFVTRWTDRPRMSVYFNDPDGNPISYAYIDLTAWAARSITVDESVTPFSQRIGTFHSDISLDIAKSLSKDLDGIDDFFSVYSIYDKDGKYIARCVKSGDSTGTDFTIQRPDPKSKKGETAWIEVAHLIVNPEWQIEISEPDFVVPGQSGKLDPRLLVIVPALRYFVTNDARNH
ncbi:MAG: hypothetical protein WCW52_10895 [Elusimicrobiales bacterium]